MKRWKGAALLLLCTVVLLRLLQGLAQPEKENAHVPVLGIVTTAAEDDRREAQSEALVRRRNMASKCWKCRSSARRRHRLKPCVR